MSDFLINIIRLLIDNDPEELNLEKQVELIRDFSIDFSSSGAFYSLKFNSDVANSAVSNKKPYVLDGLLIMSEMLNQDGAEAILHIKDGIMDYVEIWCYSGTYPKVNELDSYTLSQLWEGSNKKSTFKKDS